MFHASQSLFTLRQVRLTCVLAHRTAKQGTERTAHSARVGASQIGARDQRVGGQRAALISPQRMALLHSVVLPSGVFSRARGTAISIGPKVPVSDRVRLPLAVARNAYSSFIAGYLASTVTRASKRSVESASDQLFDKRARPSAHLGLDRIKPVVEKINSNLGCRLP